MIDRAGNTLYSNTVNPPLTQISGTDNHTKFKKNIVITAPSTEE